MKKKATITAYDFISIRIPEDVKKKLQILADEEMRTMTNMAIILIRDGIARIEAKQAKDEVAA